MTSKTSSKRKADPARLAAARVLHEVLEKKAYANLQSVHTLAAPDLEARDRAFASALIYGTISRIVSIDWLLAQSGSRPLAQCEPWVRTILRLSVWQLYWSGSVPPTAAVDEGVRLVKALTQGGGSGYVNAVLRRLAREKPALPPKKAAIYYSLPSSLYGYLKKWYPQEQDALAAAFLQPPAAVTVRVHRGRIGREALRQQLEAQGVLSEPGLYCPEALRLHLGGQSIGSLEGFRQGLFSVQDEAAMLVGHVLAPRPRQTIVDLCAAPGGKTGHVAELSVNRAFIVAFDVLEKRVKLINDMAARLGADSIEAKIGDATGRGMDPGLKDTADRVLLDAPCSGLGLLARKPEIRLTMTHEKMLELYPLQAEMLDYAATLVRPGGQLVYSTCTINPQENENAIARFLQRHPEFQLRPFATRLPQEALRHPDILRQATQGQLLMLPHRQASDGFFMACLTKNFKRRPL